MALFEQPFGDPGEDRVTAGTAAGPAVQLERRLLRDGHQVIASGALICAECELPLPGRPAVAASALIHCGWCGHTARARELIRPGINDTDANAVELVARLAI